MGMTKIYGSCGIFRKLFVLTVLFALIKRYGRSQLGFTFFEPLLNLPAYRLGVHPFKYIHRYKPGLPLYRYQYR
jgi:hypothetical protein